MLRYLCLSAYSEEGPCGVATLVSRLLEIESVDDIDEYVAESLIEFCFERVGKEVFAVEGWGRAFPMLKESLAGFESCNLALDFLSVAVNYSSSRDEEALLQLPIEQRELLLTALDDKDPE